VCGDELLAARLVASGRERVAREFGYDQDLAAWTSVFDAVLSARPR
jgi:hypothetical protein